MYSLKKHKGVKTMKKEENIMCNGNRTELYNLQKALDKMAKDLFDKNVEDDRLEYGVDSDYNIINLSWTGTKQDAILYTFLKNQKMLLSFRMTLLNADTDIDFSMWEDDIDQWLNTLGDWTHEEKFEKTGDHYPIDTTLERAGMSLEGYRVAPLYTLPDLEKVSG